MQTFHTFTRSNKTYRLVYDELYDLADLDPETLAGLDDGTYVVLGCIVTEPCAGILPVEIVDDPPHSIALHCACCQESGGKVTTDSLWGIIVKPSNSKEFEQEILSILGVEQASPLTEPA